MKGSSASVQVELPCLHLHRSSVSPKMAFLRFSTALRDSMYCKHHVELKKGLAIKSFASMQPFASYSSLQEPSGGPRGGLEDRNSGFQRRCVGHSNTISSKKAW